MSSLRGTRSAESRQACAEFGNRRRIAKKGKSGARAAMEWLKCNTVDFDESINQTSRCVVDFLREFVSPMPPRPLRPLSLASDESNCWLFACFAFDDFYSFFIIISAASGSPSHAFTHSAAFYFSGLVAGEESERQKAYKLTSERRNAIFPMPECRAVCTHSTLSAPSRSVASNTAASQNKHTELETVSVFGPMCVCALFPLHVCPAPRRPPAASEPLFCFRKIVVMPSAQTFN